MDILIKEIYLYTDYGFVESDETCDVWKQIWESQSGERYDKLITIGQRGIGILN